MSKTNEHVLTQEKVLEKMKTQTSVEPIFYEVDTEDKDTIDTLAADSFAFIHPIMSTVDECIRLSSNEAFNLGNVYINPEATGDNKFYVNCAVNKTKYDRISLPFVKIAIMNLIDHVYASVENYDFNDVGETNKIITLYFDKAELGETEEDAMDIIGTVLDALCMSIGTMSINTNPMVNFAVVVGQNSRTYQDDLTGIYNYDDDDDKKKSKKKDKKKKKK